MNSVAASSTGVNSGSDCQQWLALLSTVGSPFRRWTATSIETLDFGAGKELYRRSLNESDVLDATQRARDHGDSKLDFENGSVGVWVRLTKADGNRQLAFGTVSPSMLGMMDELINAVRQGYATLDESP